MQFNWWTFALQAINFVILVWLLHRFLYRPVLRMIDSRRQATDKRQEEIARMEVETKAKQAEIDAERAKIAAERAAALQSAATQAEKAAAAQHTKAEQEAAELLDGSRKTLAKEREFALSEARRIAVDLGVDIARRLLAEIPTEQRAEAWIERIEKHIAGLASAERAHLLDGMGSDGTMQIVTAAALPARIQAEWRDRLQRALGDGNVAMEFAADPELVAGADLHFPSAILRFSWRSELSAMRREIENHANHR
ncbi:MAG: hypothetical protein R3D05_21055 [Dongiaceae bacterium]